jgi:HD-like signal output (HDOD) protein
LVTSQESSKERLAKLLESLNDLLPFPQSLVVVRELVKDPVLDVVKLVPVVERDPALTAHLLRVCNSAQFGRARQAGSVREALVFIGNIPFLKLAVSLGMTKVFRPVLRGYGLRREQIWRHSLSVAHAAAEVSKEMGHAELEARAFPAGLLHDIGMIVLNGALADQPLKRPASATAQGIREFERAGASVDRDEAGAALMEAWNFPEVLVEAVRWHHQPAAAEGRNPLVVAVHAADRISRAAKIGADGVTSDESLDSLSELGVPVAFAEDLRARLPEATRRLLNLSS